MVASVTQNFKLPWYITINRLQAVGIQIITLGKNWKPQEQTNSDIDSAIPYGSAMG